MKTIKLILFFATISSMSLTCKKEEEHKLVDLSYSTFPSGVYPSDWGTWNFFIQNIDSIDQFGKPYLTHNWPSFSGGGACFGVKLLNKERTLYQKRNDYTSDSDSNTYTLIDTIVVDKISGTIVMALYEFFTPTPQPVKIGIFMGWFNKKTNQMEGSIEYTAKWYCSYCPIGNRNRSAQVIAGAFALNW